MKLQRSKHNVAWSAADIAKMRRLAKSGISARLAAKEMGRTHGAIKFKAMTEKVRFHAVNQPRGVQKRIDRSSKPSGTRRRPRIVGKN